MLTLCLDTAHNYLTCCLIKDDSLLASISYPCFKRQSEEIFVALTKLFDDAHIKRKDIDSICISKGPGSYTGVRIAMSIGKVIGETLNIDVYTISTLRLYANNDKDTMVLLNARANRAYVGIYSNNECIKEDCIEVLDEIDTKNYKVVGDGSIIGKDDNYPDIPSAFLATKPCWQKVEKIAYLVPEYLKESETYYR